MLIVLFSCETGSIVFEYGILLDSDSMVQTDDQWLGLITLHKASMQFMLVHRVATVFGLCHVS